MNINDIIPRVIEIMKTSRQAHPTVYSELDTGSIQAYPLFNLIGDAHTKAHTLFTAGRKAGQQHNERDLVETCFVTEVWLTRYHHNPDQHLPINRAQTEGVLFTITRNTAPFETHVKAYHIKRERNKPTELVYLSENTDPRGIMGRAFIAGWRSRAMSTEEVRRLQPQGIHAFLL